VFAVWCYMCRCSQETIDHLLLHCGVAREGWYFIFRSFGVSWVLSERVVNLLFG
jgi:hypothetical protein